MMKKLLNLLDEGRTLSQHELAVELGVSATMLNAQIEYLEQLGVLRRIESSRECTNGNCKSCSSKCCNSRFSALTMWEKSRKPLA